MDQKLYDVATYYVDKNKTVLDLYCGTGTIGIYVSDYCDTVIGVDCSESGIRDANNNKELLKAFNITSHNNPIVKDYNAFKDKDLLDKFRSDILEDLSDKGFIDEVISKDLINSEIDEITYGYNLSREERNYLFNLIDGEVNGYGPITELFEDDNITEIMVNSANEIFIEIDGKVQKDESVSFINDEHIIRTIERLVEPTGKNIDVNHPMIDARLDDGSRINAVIPPLSKCPIITIRKFKKN